MKTIILLTILYSTSTLAQQSMAPQSSVEDGVVISTSVAPDKACQKLSDVYVSIHQPGSNYTNLAKEVKSQGGDFVVIKTDSPYYSYKFGGEVFKCRL